MLEVGGLRLPAVAYPGSPDRPSGWIALQSPDLTWWCVTLAEQMLSVLLHGSSRAGQL